MSGPPLSLSERHLGADHWEQVAVDFFGRPIVPKTPGPEKGAPGSKKAVDKPVTKYRVAYRFNEGNSAAVRKPVKVSAFL